MGVFLFGFIMRGQKHFCLGMIISDLFGYEREKDMNNVAIELRGITKRFGSVVANSNVNLTVCNGEILSLLGENGSGKTTLMNMISGIYHPDEGQIIIGGEEVSINSPHDAFNYKIGMIHQHFKLVDLFTAAENIVLGLDEKGKFDIKAVSKKVAEISAKYGFDIDPSKKIYEMSVSEKQTVEIIKVLYRGADILILDEPTAVLTPQETRKLFDILRRMRDDGKAIIIITHKLHEVLDLSDKVAVLRHGEYVGTVNTSEADENILTEMMVGKKVELNIERPDPVNPQDRLVVEHIDCKSREGVKLLDDVSFTARSGEILGIAGIAGSGQRELLEAIAGLQKLDGGSIIYHNPKNGKAEDLRDKTPLEIRELGVRLSFVPEDRLGMGLVGNMGVVDNMMLRSYRRGKSVFLERHGPEELAQKIIKDLEVVTPDAETPVRRLSGGNVQKVLLGREIASSPTLLMAAYPVRGLDINSSYLIYDLLNDQKKKGVAVIFVGEDLDVLLDLCDRILVIGSGRITGILDARNATKNEVGYLMTKTHREEETEDEE
jgi:simple sugar transport system ATP-binding protein